MSTPPPMFPPPEPPAAPPVAEPTGRAREVGDAPHRVGAEPAPWSRSRRWTVGMGIAAAAAGLVAALGGGILALSTALLDTADDLGLVPNTVVPLAEGASGDPRPAEPTDCDDPCFGVAAIDHARLEPDVYGEAGLTMLYGGAGSEPQSQASAEFDIAANGWTFDKGSPDSCFVTYPDVPIAYALDEVPATGDGSIHFIAARGTDDEFSTSLHTFRLFDTTAAAQSHMERLHDLLDDCERYELGTDWNATVTPAPALSLPSSVAGVGWVEVEDYGWRYYSFDLVRANAVVRITLSTDNGVTEERFRALVEDAALDMAQWPFSEE